MEFNEISEKEFFEWKTLPVTKKMYEIINNYRNDLVESLINGETLLSEKGTAETTAKIVGIIYGIDLFLKAKYGDE